MTTKYSKLLSLVGVAVYLSVGCAGVTHWMDDQIDSTKSEISGDTTQTAVIIANTEIVMNFQDRDVTDWALGDDHGETIGALVKNSDGETYQGKVQRGVIVFDGLPPGQYAIAQVVATRSLNDEEKEKLFRCGASLGSCPDIVKVLFTLHPNAQAELTFDLEPGDVAYGGMLRLDENHDPPSGFDVSADDVALHRHTAKDEITIDRADVHKGPTMATVSSWFLPGQWKTRIKAALSTS